MFNLFKELVKKYGIGFVLGAATLDGYRRQYISDKNKEIFVAIENERSKLSEVEREVYKEIIDAEWKKANNLAVIDRYKLRADIHKEAVDKYELNQSEYNKNELNKAKNQLDVSMEEVKKLDISDNFVLLYNKYIEFLSTLSPDKIVCLFNLITDVLILSSFVSVLSILLSENIINKLKFLEKYPRILKILKLRNTINKKISQFYLFMHFIVIIFSILGNIFMFFIN